MKFIKNKWIYLVGFLFSILFIGLYFINTESPWCIISCSIGASLIGAIVLATSIDIRNDITLKAQNQNIKRFSNVSTYQAIYKLLNFTSFAIGEVYKIKGQSFVYENKNPEEIFSLFDEEIEKIKLDIAPSLFANEVVSEQELLKYRKQQEIRKEILSYNDAIGQIRNEFHKCREELKSNKNILLTSEIMSEMEIRRIDSLLSILGPQREQLGKEEPFIELGKSMKEISDLKFMDVFEIIGLERFVINNKKGFNLEEKKK